jgi:Flp pilus assembly CpaF family ATPase
MIGNRFNLVETLDLLDAWGADHPAGIGAIHAGFTLGARRRFEQLADFLPWPALVADGIIHNDGSLLFEPAP